MSEDETNEMLTDARRDIGADLRRLADKYRFAGHMFHAAVLERVLRGQASAPFETAEFPAPPVAP